jgi:hypothetical protein
MQIERQFREQLVLDTLSKEYRLTGGLQPNYDYLGLDLLLRMRVVLAAANATLVPVLSPATFIKRVLVQGTAEGYGRVVLVDLPGSVAFLIASLTSGQLPLFDEDNLVTGGGVTGTYDVQLLIPVRFACIGLGNKAEEMAMRTLLPGAAFSDIEVVIETGGSDSIVDRAATPTTVTLTAYGSGAGSPTLDVSRVIVKHGVGERPVSGMKYLVQKFMAADVDTSAAVVDSLITNLGKNQLYSRIFLRNGERATDSTPAFGTTTEANLTRVKLKTGGSRTIRDENFLSMHHGCMWQAGYDPGWRQIIDTAAAAFVGGIATRQFRGVAFWDFVEHGNLSEAFSTLGWKSDLEIWGNLTALTSGRLEVPVEVLLRRT